jgi:hypothetical protein
MTNHTPFVAAALAILATEKGDVMCTVEGDGEATMREAWSVDQLVLWETEFAPEYAMDEWLAYTGFDR